MVVIYVFKKGILMETRTEEFQDGMVYCARFSLK